MKKRRRGPAGGTAHCVVLGSSAPAARGLRIRRREGCIVANGTMCDGRRSRRGGIRPHANGKRIAAATTRRSPAETRYKKSNKYFMREIL
ncbi:hypothetical protein [Burkholderia sp. BCC0097]|uniref:hypothetical protein n=1 Tax=Burkholderia sp. BCC0097 TaxID=2676289 RepID=UPI001FC8362F|nr:hypothetical protein [Burkholderia sp. BCC0097]